MAVKDMKGFRKRCKNKQAGEKTGRDETIISRLLSVEYDIKMNAKITGIRQKFYDDNKHLL